MKHTFLITFLFCQFLLINTGQAKQLHWLITDEGDKVNLTAPLSTPLSTSDDTTRLLMHELSDYDFNLLFAQGKSVDLLLNKLPESCAPNRVKNTERAKQYLFSLPANLYLNLRLYYKSSMQESLPESSLNSKYQLSSIPKLFNSKDLRTLGVDYGRSYGAFLDQQISSLDSHNLVTRKGGIPSTSLIHMLVKGRISFIIDFPNNVKASLSSYKNPEELSSIEIAGTPDYIAGYVACNRSAQGQQAIKAINVALKKLYNQYSFYYAHSRYLDSADIADFNRIYKAIFKVDIPKKPKHKH